MPHHQGGRLFFAGLLTAAALAAGGGCGSEPRPAGGVPSPSAAKVAAANRETEEDVKGPKAAEAREWLDPKHTDHGVFELGNEQARKVVEGFYKAGAKKVYFTGIDSLGDQKITNSIVVELPKEPEARHKCFAWEKESGILEGEAPNPDVGQRFLSYTTD